MPRKPEVVRPGALLYDIRREVSGILGRPFTETIDHRAFRPDRRVLALWAAGCAGRVLPFFEEAVTGDPRPRIAVAACREWAATGIFRMADIRRASLGAHAAAKDAQVPAAAYAAHAAGQAAAAAHVPAHAFGCAVYAIRAVAAHDGDPDTVLVRERAWQREQLLRIAGSSTPPEGKR